MKQIKLTQDKVALVDDEDFETLNKYKWHYSRYSPHFENGYAKRRNPNGKPALIRMQHMILPLKKGYMVDHKNGNGLDNRRENLRLVTKSQNMMNCGLQRNNKSGYKGVCWHESNKKWRAQIFVNGRQYFLGLFKNKKDAARAYNDAAPHYHGEYAYLNKI